MSERYERYELDGTSWRHEVREVVDVGPRGVLYRRIVPETQGTTTDQGWTEDPPRMASEKEWRAWVRLARRVVC